MSWNNTKGFANWTGGGSATSNNYILPSISSVNISATNISTSNLTAYNGYISYNSNITTTTNAVILNPGTILTAFDGTLYVNGEPITAPSSFSTIADWSKFPALTNVNMNFSSISSVLNIECSNQITTRTLIGTEGVAAVAIQGVNVSGVNGYFPTISTNTFRNNGTMQNVGTFANIGPVTMNETLNVGLDITCDTIVRAPQVDTSYAYVFKELRVAPIFPVGPTIGSIINISTITGDTIIARKAISTNLISSGVGYFSSIYVGHIDIGSNIIVPDIVCSNITVVDTATIHTLENTDGANFQGGATIEDVLNMNANINFPYNTTSDPLVLPPQTQPLYDMSYVRNITCGGVVVQGGWNGNTVVPPYHNNSLVTIGNDGGITSPGVVVINGQNPGIPGENITNALTVRGDMEVDFGILTTYNGLVCEPFNEFANAIEVNGISELNGVVNILGATTIEGTTGILGNTTITGAVEITGGVLITGGLAQLGGDFTLGNSGTPYHGVINTPLALNNELNMGNNIIENVSILTATQVTANNLSVSNITLLSTLRTFKAENISTNSLVVYQGLSGEDVVGGISFSDISNNFIAGIGLGSSGPYPLGIASLNSIYTIAQGSILTDAGGNMELTAQSNATLTGLSNATLQAGGNVVVVSADATATLHAYDTVSILSDTAGIGLNSQTGVFMNDNSGAILNVASGNIDGSTTTGDIILTSGNNVNVNASSNFNVVANNYIFCQATSECAISTTKITLTRDVYMSNIYGIGGTSIRVNDNINMSTSVLYAGAVQSSNVYTPNLYGLYGTSNPINMNANLNMSSVNSIVGVNELFCISVSTNTIKANNISTNNLIVSTINNKLYPYTSTLNAPPSTFSYAASNTQSRTVPYVLYSNVAFPNAGWFNVSQKAIFTRASGTSDTHQSVLYTPGAFISTPSIVDGYSTLPYLNQNNSSTFTTLTTDIYISSTQLNRNIILYNDTNNGFQGRLFMDRLVVTYNPSRGINPE